MNRWLKPRYNKMKMANFWQKILFYAGYALERLSSSLPVGGLEISDSVLRFLRIDGKNLITASLRLPPGIMIEGKIQDYFNFLSALKTLHNQLNSDPKIVLPVVVSLPSENVYVLSFNVPEVGEREMAEVVRLNLQMNSPLESFDNVYTGWQKLNHSKKSNNQTDILGVYTSRSLVDDLEKILKEAGFYPVAFEFSALAFARLFESLMPVSDSSFLVVNISPNGLDFSIIQNNNLYFSYFRSWRSIKGENKQMTVGAFQETIQNEVQKVVNFASSRLLGSVKNVFIVSSGLEKEIINVIQGKLNIKTTFLRLAQYPSLNPNWFGVLGSALRGLIPRSRDHFISLFKVGAEEEFYQNQTLAFASFWRDIFVGGLAALIIIFLISDLAFLRMKDAIEHQLIFISASPENHEAARFKEEAVKFNRSVRLIQKAQADSRKFSSLLNKLAALSGAKITINKFSFPSFSSPAILQGAAVSEKAVLDFKNLLAEQPQFSDVNAPITGIKPAGGGFFNFEATFNIKSLEF